MKEQIKILNVPINNISVKEAKEVVLDALNQDKQLKIFTPNPEMMLRSENDSKFKDALLAGDLLIPDGAGIVLMSWIFGESFKERVIGVDFMLDICNIAEKTQKKIFLLGGEGGVAEKTQIALEEKFPNLVISGFSENVNLFFDEVKNSDAQIIFIALGAPGQELWITEYIEKLPNVKIAMGVGGSFDMISGKTKRAPRILRKLYLEWLWRFILEPKRVKRIVNAVVIFPIVFIKNKLTW